MKYITSLFLLFSLSIFYIPNQIIAQEENAADTSAVDTNAVDTNAVDTSAVDTNALDTSAVDTTDFGTDGGDAGAADLEGTVGGTGDDFGDIDTEVAGKKPTDDPGAVDADMPKTEKGAAQPKAETKKPKEVAEKPKKTVEKPEPLKREIELSEKNQPLQRGDIPSGLNAMVKKIESHNKKIGTITKTIEQTILDMQTKYLDLDGKLDIFMKNTSELLGRLRRSEWQMRRYLNRRKASPPDIYKVEVLLNALSEDLTKVTSQRDSIQNDEESLRDDLANAGLQKNDAVSTAKDALLLKEKLVTAKNQVAAQAVFNNIDRKLERVTKAKEDVEIFQKSFKKQFDEIVQQKNAIEAQMKKLQTNVSAINQQIEAIGPIKAKPATKPADAKPADGKQKAVKAKLIELKWYERIIASFANGLIAARNWVRKITGLSATSVDKKVEAKRKEIVADKKKLEDSKETMAKDSGLQHLKTIASSTYILIKRGFLALGRGINQLLERASSIGKKQPEAQTKTEQIPSIKKPQPETPKKAKPVPSVEKKQPEEPKKLEKVPSIEKKQPAKQKEKQPLAS